MWDRSRIRDGPGDGVGRRSKVGPDIGVTAFSRKHCLSRKLSLFVSDDKSRF